MDMARTMTGLFDRLEDARAAYNELAAHGYSTEMSLIARDPRRNNDRDIIADELDEVTAFESEAAADAAKGMLIGAGAGLLAGMSALVIPVIGPIVVLGTVATGLAIGGAAGAMIGTLEDGSIPKAESDYMMEGLNRGGSVVIFRAPDDKAAERGLDILRWHNVVDMNERVADWKEHGWLGYVKQSTSPEQFDTEAGRPDEKKAA
jgi:hypothetical protein